MWGLDEETQIGPTSVHREGSAPQWLIGWTLPLGGTNLIAGSETSEFKFSATMKVSL